MRKKRAQESIERTTETERVLSQSPNYPEHQAFSRQPQRHSIESALNPVPMHRGSADNPEYYGERGTDMTNQNDPDIYNALHPETPEEKKKRQDEKEFQNQVDEQRKLG